VLNPQQQAAVEKTDQPLLVLAGAGCGKTRVITEKMAHLVNQGLCEPHRLFAITFTNKAAKEMKQRAMSMVSSGDQLNISTFHALGLRLMQQEIAHTGFMRGFSILDASECQKVIQELLPTGIKKELANQLQWQISGWKNKGWRPDQVETTVPMAAEVYQHYLDYMLSINAMDFDDLILQPLWLLMKQPEVLQRWRQHIGYLMVDEYQDTNTSQYQLVRQLMGQGSHLTCVGDDDQSIYGWRGAQIENLSLLQRDFPQLAVVKLEQNYRSSSTILNAANAVIKNNPHPFEKKIWSDLGEGELIHLTPYLSAEEEAEQVITDILFQRKVHHKNYQDYAILYRSNHQAKLMEQALRMNNVPYQMSGGRSFFDYAEIKDLMAYIRLLSNPKDNAAFLRVINTPKRGIGMQTVKQISQQAKRHNQTFFVACQNPDVLASLPTQAQQKIRDFVRIIKHHQQEKRSAEQVVASLVREIDYLNWVNLSANNKMAKINKSKLVRDFLKWIEAIGGKDHLAMEDLLNYLSLQTNQDDEEGEDAVRMMTLHAAKGLEFEHVYLIGVEEGILPHANSMAEADDENEAIEEERRLMYVGITRAMRQLKISYVKKRKRKFQPEDSEEVFGPSRFLDEIPEELLAGARQNAPSEAEQKENNRKNFAALKAMLE